MTAKNVCKQTNETATSILAEVGDDFGYRDVEATFTAFRDMKVTWKRSYTWIQFSLSDYLQDAPDEVLRDIGTTLFSRISGKPTETNTAYGDDATAWLTAPEFARTHQNIFINRCRGFDRESKVEGGVHDLNDSLDRISKLGLVNIDEDTKIGWVPASSRGRRTGFSSVLMKVIGITETLDDPEVSPEMFDFCVYCELCHIAMGFDPSTMYDPERLSEMICKFPDWEEINADLEDLGLKVSN